MTTIPSNAPAPDMSAAPGPLPDVTELKKQINSRLDADVKAGRISSDQATEIRKKHGGG